MTPKNDAGAPAGTNAEELIRQREQLRAWIARLDEVQAGAPTRVAQRVRADYEDRLRRVTEELSSHRDEIERDLESARGALAAAEERRAHAADALDETQLRHLIGELGQAAWDEQRPRLEADVAGADEELARARAEVERLSSLAGEIREPEPQPQPGTAYAPDAAREPQATAEPEYEPEIAFADEAPGAGAGGAPEAEFEPEITLSGEPGRPTAGAPSGAAPADAPSGEDLAAWINEVEAEAGRIESGTGAQPAPGSDADWDPFANEFGGAPASPQTQPGDAADDLPWLDAIDNAAGRGWSPPAPAGGDDLAFLDNLDAPGAGAAPPPPAGGGAAAGGDLQADDLAFLEELDRAISGGASRQPAASPPPPPAAQPAQAGFTGGSGDGFSPLGSTAEQRKRGEALLCKECGAINEPQAWYCEICGSEL